MKLLISWFLSRLLRKQSLSIGMKGKIIHALATLGDDTAVDALADAVEDGSYGHGSEAIQALGTIANARATRALIDGLGHEEWRVVSHAAQALGKAKKVEAVQPLIMCLEHYEASVRGHAAEALGQIGDKRAVQPLLDVLFDADSLVRQRAGLALAVLQVDPNSLTLRQKVMYYYSRDTYLPHKPQEMPTDLQRIDIAELGDLLNDECCDVRFLATGVLSTRLQDPGTATRYIPLLKDPDDRIRRKAIEVLSNLKEKRAVKDLEHVLLHDEDWWIRGKAAQALGEIGDPGAIDTLQGVMNSGLCDIGEKAVEAINKLLTHAPWDWVFLDRDTSHRLAEKVRLCDIEESEVKAVRFRKLDESSAPSVSGRLRCHGCGDLIEFTVTREARMAKWYESKRVECPRCTAILAIGSLLTAIDGMDVLLVSATPSETRAGPTLYPKVAIELQRVDL